MITFGELKESRINQIAGNCVDSEQFKSLVNEATRLMLRRGDFPGAVVPIYTCIRRGCVVFPRYVGAVRKINFCRYPLTIQNNWYQFLNFNEHSGIWQTWRHGRDITTTGLTSTCLFQSIQGDGRYVRIYPAVRADVGSEVLLLGEDNNGQPLRTRNEDGTWSDGITVTVALPYGSTNVFVRRIDRVLKTKTQGALRAYAYWAENDVLEDLAVWDASEVSPTYSQYTINPGCLPNNIVNSTNNCDRLGIFALVKLRFIPVEVDADMVLIDNLDALKYMVQSIRYGEAGDVNNQEAFKALAVKEGNLDIWNEQTEDQVPVISATFNGMPLGQQTVF
jgi:hypothetical protein